MCAEKNEMPSKALARHVNTKSHENVTKPHTAEYREDVGDEPKEHMLFILSASFLQNFSRFSFQIKKCHFENAIQLHFRLELNEIRKKQRLPA